MSRLVFLLFASALILVSAEDGASGSDREEKLRSALIDAFQNIKKASAKGGFDDEGPLNSDLIGSIAGRINTTSERSTTEDNFDLFVDEDGLTFSEAFGDVNIEDERKTERTIKADYVQHLVKTTKANDKPNNNKPGNIVSKFSDSIRTAVNETRNNFANQQVWAPENISVSNETVLLGLESMLRIFDSDILLSQWNEIKKNLKGECKREVTVYVEGLQEKQTWAMKSE